MSIFAHTTKSALRHAPRVSVAASMKPSGSRYSSTMHDNDPNLLETEKQRNLSKSQHQTSTPHAHAPGWNEHLASASEAHVKADRVEATPEELQSSTIDYIQKRHTPDDRAASTTASASRDSVDGPLGSAAGSGGSGGPQELVKRTVKKQTTEIHEESVPTHSEETVKADRGEI